MNDTILSTCKSCREKNCEELYWKDSVVSSDYFAVPLDCPLRVRDESKFRWELHSISDFEISRITGDVWVSHNYNYRYSNGKQDEIRHIVNHFREGKIIMIARSRNRSYTPWTQSEFISGSTSTSSLISNKKKTVQSQPVQMPAEVIEQKPFEIKASGIEHLDQSLQKQYYRGSG